MKIIRQTHQRDKVYDVVQTHHGQHLTAEEIYELIHVDEPHISKGTVYRNLGILCEEGKISKVITFDHTDRYDANPNIHAHFMCQACAKVYDVETDKMPNLIDPHFNVMSTSVLFSGVCPVCKEKREESH